MTVNTAMETGNASATLLDDLVQTFFAPVDFSHLDIEERAVGFSDYQSGLVGLRERGFDRYLTPREHFAVRSYVGCDERILAVKRDMLRDNREWLHASVRAGPGMVSVAPGFPGYAAGVVPVSLSFEVRNLRDGWNDISVFPPDFRAIMSDQPFEQLNGMVGLSVLRDNVWRPVARGSNVDYYFGLGAYGYPRASRGVRREDA